MRSPNNRLIISVAGSGKTTYLVREAVEIKNERVLITTYTEANEQEIKKKFYELNGSIPDNITIQSWFSFLLQHGVRPYQGAFYEGEIRGMLLVNGPSGVAYRNSMGIPVPFSEEKDFYKHYFSPRGKIYSDKITKFIIRCIVQTSGALLDRLARIFPFIFIDEVQDLAGNDLELLRLLFKTGIRVTMVGDPRQVTYLTHHEKKYNNYKDGNIKQFILDKAKRLCIVDEETLSCSHRNHGEICRFSSRLYPELAPSEPCTCEGCRSMETEHSGVYVVRAADVDFYCSQYAPTILRYQLAKEPEWNYGNCKGLGFDRVLIYPTEGIKKYLNDGLLTKIGKTRKDENAFDRPKFYVALTRARYSAAIVYDYSEQDLIGGVKKWARE